MNLSESVHRVTEPAAVDLDRASTPTRFVPDCEPKHFQSVFIGCTRTVLFQRLNRRWHEPDLVELGLLLACAGDRQMGVVYRIEATTENAEAHELGLEIGGWGLGLFVSIRLRYRHCRVLCRQYLVP